MNSKAKFPDDFFWGAATSAYQVEGGNYNDWSEWEQSGHVRNQEVSGRADDEWHLFEKDIELIKDLGLNCFRFSIEWSRIEPLPGDFQREAIDRYKAMVKLLRKEGIEPMVTLHHFTHPVWLEDWTRQGATDYFERYVRFVVENLGEDVAYWCTINEPNVLVSMGYQLGIWPPGIKSMRGALKAQANLLSAHKYAYNTIHEVYFKHNWQPPKVSMSLNLHYYGVASANPLNKLVAKIAGYIANHRTIRKAMGSLDYLGVNYYFSHRVNVFRPSSVTRLSDDRVPAKKNDLGWNVDPDSLRLVLNQLKQYQLPIIVTENGIADGRDALREWFIVKTTNALLGAIEDGVDLKGYLHWSLLDNFEWQEGYFGQFGLYEVDRKTELRTKRRSADVYAKIVRSSSIPEELREKYL